MAENATQAALLLQFGHGCDAVETAKGLRAVVAGFPLQFGHGCDAVETAFW